MNLHNDHMLVVCFAIQVTSGANRYSLKLGILSAWDRKLMGWCVCHERGLTRVSLSLGTHSDFGC